MLHAIQRARERYYINLSLWDLEDLERQIRTGKARFVLEVRRGSAVYLVKTMNNYRLYAVYRPAIGRIVTFLPPSVVRRKRDKAMSDTTGTAILTASMGFDLEAVIETEGDTYTLYLPEDPGARFSGATVSEAFRRLFVYAVANGDFEFVE